MRTAKPCEKDLTLGVWEPKDEGDICDIAVVAKGDLDYLGVALEDSGRKLYATVVIAPNWSNNSDLIAFCVRERFFCNASLVPRSLAISQLAKEWVAWRSAPELISCFTPSIFEHLSQIRGNRVAQFCKLVEDLQSVIYERLLRGEGLGSPWSRDRFQCSSVSMVPLYNGFKHIKKLVDSIGNEHLKGSGISEMCTAIDNIFASLQNSRDQMTTRVAYSVILGAGGKYWMRIRSFQLAFLYFHRAIDALLQALALDLGLVGLDEEGSLFSLTRNRRKQKFTVGSGVHLILDSGEFVQARSLFGKILDINEKRNWCLIGHGTGGVVEQTAKEAEETLNSLSKFLPDSQKQFFSIYSKKLTFNFSFPCSVPYDLIDDLDSGIRISKLN